MAKHKHQEIEQDMDSTYTDEPSMPAGGIPEGHQLLTINKKAFIVRAPYFEGHVLTETEAQVLNRTFAENLRNNFASQMKNAAEKEGRELTQEDLNAYQADYAFGVRRTRTGTSVSPVEVEERKLALEAIKVQFKKKNIIFKTVPKEKLEQFVVLAVETGKFRARAEKIVAERHAAAVPELDLDLDVAA